MESKIVIIDGNSLINRAFYAVQRPMITKEGIYTQGVYGFINMLQKIENDHRPEYLTVAFDLKAPTFRHIEYEEYKAGRKAMPPELAMQMPLIKDVLSAMNIKILELEGFEADDIIGTVARKAEKEGIEALIITGDKDALQLVSEHTRVMITKKGITEFELYDIDKMKERYAMTPEQFIDLKGLMGDSSDNIPGIPGVGEKTGIKLIEQFGSIENMLAHTDEIGSAKLRLKVEENAQLAIMSKRLATINVNVPLEIDIEMLKLREPDYSRLTELYTKLEFNSFLKKLKAESKSDLKSIDISDIEKIIAEDEQDLKHLDVFNDSREIFLKTYGNFSHVEVPFIEGIFLMDRKNAIFIDTVSAGTEKTIKKLNEMKPDIIGHDLKNDIYALMCHGLESFNIAFDTAIAEYVLDPSRNKYDLRNIVLERLHCDIDIQNSEEDSAGKQLDMFSDIRTRLSEEAVRIGSAVFSLMKAEQKELSDKKLERVFKEAELPLIEVLAAMEKNGVRVNGDFLDQLGIELKNKLQVIEENIYQRAGKKFNINSPMQLGNILFEEMKLPFHGKKTKRGYSTGADVLEKIKDTDPIVGLVLEYRNFSKLNSTYVEGMKPLIGYDGKIRAHFQQTVTATGRISCTEPNLQNIPIRQELGRTLRKAFVADEDDYILIGADYSQIELRVLAHLSGDDELIAAFNRGDDIHKLTASRVLGIPFDQVTPQERSRAKAVNFGVIYGMSGFGLSEELQISRKEAEKYIDDYFSKHTRVKEYMDRQIISCREKGYSETILGRKRPIHEINASSYMVRQLGERLAMNSPIQGSAADIIKVAMIKVYKSLRKDFPDTKLVLQVHDELILSAPKKDAAAVKEILRRDMEEAVELAVKLVADVNEGYAWFDLK